MCNLLIFNSLNFYSKPAWRFASGIAVDSVPQEYIQNKEICRQLQSMQGLPLK